MLLRVNIIIAILWIFVSCYLSYEITTINKPKSLVKAHATLQCHRREYTFKATRTDLSGRQCWEYITAMSCWGRCDSGEIADWRFPYKKTFHPVCIHDKKRIRRIRLKHCDPGATDDLKFFEYTEALTCACHLCQSSTVSCEGVVSPIGTRAP